MVSVVRGVYRRFCDYDGSLFVSERFGGPAQGGNDITKSSCFELVEAMKPRYFDGNSPFVLARL